LKPQNLMFGDAGRVYVLDWGLAERIGSVNPKEIAGTPSFMAPEQASNPSAVNECTDVYALGAILYTIATGECVRHVNVREVGHPAMRKIVSRNRITRPRFIDESIEPELESIMMRALATRQDDRYQSAAELKEDLQAYLEGRAVQAHEYTWRERTRKALQNHVGKVMSAAAGLVLTVSLTAGAVSLTQTAARAEAQKEAAVARANEEAASRRAAEAGLSLEAQRREAAETLASREEVLKRKFKYGTDGREFIDARDYDAALRLYDAAISEFSDESEFYVRRAECHHAKREFDLSIADCEQAIELDPSNHAAYRRLGIVYAAKGVIHDTDRSRIDSADEALGEAVRLGSIESMYDRAKLWHLVAVRENDSEMARRAIGLYDEYARTSYSRNRSQDIARSKAELERVVRGN